ncbi:MAG: DMT family transporter [Ignavibacteria bacterium]|nr:DMT family transporter [Ignavibacteria bacterium]
MSHPASTLFFTSLALTAFAANSILCRLALADQSIDAVSFTTVRLLSGAVMLFLLVSLRDRRVTRPAFRLLTAVALFCYAAPFSLAYVSIPAGAGALILFGAVQVTMIGWDILRGYRLSWREWGGLVLALGGLVILTMPGSVDPGGAMLMAAAGVSWGIYSIYGKGTADPLKGTAGNFAVAMIFTLPLSAFSPQAANVTPAGVLYAAISGAVTSGIGYALWYRALRGLTATRAGIIQLLVPVIAAAGGVALLDESITGRMIIAAALIFAGVGMAVTGRQKAVTEDPISQVLR